MSFLSFSLRGKRAEGPAIPASDRGFLLGDGVFDTLTAFAGRPVLWQRHRDRLLKAAAALGIDAAPDTVDEAFGEACAALNGRHAIIRTTVTRGAAERGLWPASPGPPTVLVTAQPWPRDLVGQPARLVTALAPRNELSPLSRLKTLNFLENVLAARQAVEAGADDALILNRAGHVASSTIANVFVVRDDRLLTPPLTDGVLDGIIRAFVMEEAASLGLTAIESRLTPADILAGEGTFLTNSVRLLRPVLSLDGTPAAQSPVTDRILSHLRKTLEQG